MRAFLDEAEEHALRLITCQPIPARWTALAQRTDLNWQKIAFNGAELNSVPREPGFFCFFIGPPPSSLPPVGYPLYFGKTERTLRRRFAEYIQEQHDRASRPQADERRIGGARLCRVFRRICLERELLGRGSFSHWRAGCLVALVSKRCNGRSNRALSAVATFAKAGES